MEINKNTDVTGVVVTEDITEGRMVLFTSNPGYPSDLTGRLTDLPGVKLPDTPAEAAEAMFVLTWQNDRREPPLINYPSYSYALRHGFDQTGNAPFTGTVYLTYPGYQESVVIPSGSQALAFGGGVFTVPSGQYVYSPAIQVPGCRLRACDAATDGAAFAGMLAVMASGTTRVAITERFNTSTFALTFRTLRLPG